MRKPRSVENKNDFDLLVELLEKSSPTVIQIAYRTALRKHPYLPKEIIGLICGTSDTDAGLIFQFFKLMSQVTGNMELAFRRGADYRPEKKQAKKI